eukprot:6878313-Pyramimonas_sp.AAC.1
MRGGVESIQLHHINSHLSWEDAEAKGFPRHAWYGNGQADRFADAAAENHDIDSAQMGCYEWVNSTAAL